MNNTDKVENKTDGKITDQSLNKQTPNKKKNKNWKKKNNNVNNTIRNKDFKETDKKITIDVDTIEDFFSDFFEFDDPEISTEVAKDFLQKYPNMLNIDDLVGFAMTDEKEIFNKYLSLVKKKKESKNKYTKKISKKSKKHKIAKSLSDTTSEISMESYNSDINIEKTYDDLISADSENISYEFEDCDDDNDCDCHHQTCCDIHDSDQHSTNHNNHNYPIVGNRANCLSRLNTFDKWSYKNNGSPPILAQAGFYYIGKTDTVRCFFCGIEVSEFEEDDDPFDIHYNANSECPYISSTYLPKALRETNVDKNTEKIHQSLSNLFGSLSEYIDNTNQLPSNMSNFGNSGFFQQPMYSYGQNMNYFRENNFNSNCDYECTEHNENESDNENIPKVQTKQKFNKNFKKSNKFNKNKQT